MVFFIVMFFVEFCVEDGMVYFQLLFVEELDVELGMKKWKVKKGDDGGEGVEKFKELDKKIGFVGRRGKKFGVKLMINGVVGLKMKRLVELMVGGCGLVLDW